MGLVHVIGEKPVAKVLDYFLVNQFWDYSLRDVGKETGVSYRTLQEIIPRLVGTGILEYTRTEGKAKMYALNRESLAAKELKSFVREVDLEYAASLAKKDIAVATS